MDLNRILGRILTCLERHKKWAHVKILRSTIFKELQNNKNTTVCKHVTLVLRISSSRMCLTEERVTNNYDI